MFSLRDFCLACYSINSLVFENSTETSLNTFSAIFNFCVSSFVVSVLLARALDLTAKHPSVLFVIELLENPFFTQTALMLL